tara:strand:- start:953 stop:1246 length:294 start_codon:yes stop_codon:yes gene_type:complete
MTNKKEEIKQMSRVARWNHAVSQIETAIETIKSLNAEYEDWKMNLEGAENADNLMQGATYEKLEALEIVGVETICDDFEYPLNELKEVDLPRGFGRD